MAHLNEKWEEAVAAWLRECWIPLTWNQISELDRFCRFEMGTHKLIQNRICYTSRKPIFRYIYQNFSTSEEL